MNWIEFCKKTRVAGPFAITFTFLGYDSHDYPTVRSSFTTKCSETGVLKEFTNDFQPRITEHPLRELYLEAKRIYSYELGEWFCHDGRRPFVNHG